MSSRNRSEMSNQNLLAFSREFGYYWNTGTDIRIWITLIEPLKAWNGTNHQNHSRVSENQSIHWIQFTIQQDKFSFSDNLV